MEYASGGCTSGGGAMIRRPVPQQRVVGSLCQPVSRDCSCPWIVGVTTTRGIGIGAPQLRSYYRRPDVIDQQAQHHDPAAQHQPGRKIKRVGGRSRKSKAHLDHEPYRCHCSPKHSAKIHKIGNLDSSPRPFQLPGNGIRILSPDVYTSDGDRAVIRSVVDLATDRTVRWQQLCGSVDRMAFDPSLQHVVQTEVGLDVVAEEKKKGMQDKGTASQSRLSDCLHIFFLRDRVSNERDKPKRARSRALPA